MADIILEEDGRLHLDGRVLLAGDLVEVELEPGEWTVAQVEVIRGEYQLTLFDSDWGRLIWSRPIPARRLATRPVFLPPFGEDWKPEDRAAGDPADLEGA